MKGLENMQERERWDEVSPTDIGQGSEPWQESESMRDFPICWLEGSICQVIFTLM